MASLNVMGTPFSIHDLTREELEILHDEVSRALRSLDKMEAYLAEQDELRKKSSDQEK